MKILTEQINFSCESALDTDPALFFDIETTGLSKQNSQVYLIGCSYTADGKRYIRQYLAESALDEARILDAFLEFAAGYDKLIHFNGSVFDVPYIDFKSDYYGFKEKLSEKENFDIYRQVKPLKKLLELENLNQKSIERFLKIKRDDEMNGGELISYYYDFERTGSKQSEKLILLHNFDDMKGMLKILPILNYLEILKGNFKFKNMKTIADTAVFDYELPRALPVAFEHKKDSFLIAGDERLLEINAKIYSNNAYFPLEDFKNYLYLPEEDKVIHKDVGQFVEKSRVRKATKKDCFLKKESEFLMQYEEVYRPVFYMEKDRKTKLFEMNGEMKNAPKQLEKYAFDIINSKN